MNRALSTAVIGLSAISITAVGSAAQAANLVTNGGFVPSNLARPSAYIGGGQVTIPGWTINRTFSFVVADGTTVGENLNFAGYGPDPVNGGPISGPRGTALSLYTSPGQTVNSPDGSGWFLALDGAYGSKPKVSQTLTGLTPGQQYTVSFYQASGQQRGFDGDTTDYFDVTFGSTTQRAATLFHPSKAPVSPWQQQTLTFTADNSTQVLSFLATGAPVGLPPFALLSGVSVQAVSAVPEPFTILGSAAAIGFGTLFKRRLNAQKSKHDDNN